MPAYFVILWASNFLAVVVFSHNVTFGIIKKLGRVFEPAHCLSSIL